MGIFGNMLLGLAVAANIAAPAINQQTTQAEKMYPHFAVVSQVDYQADTITAIDAEGRIWEWYGTSDWAAGDGAALLMGNNGTPETVLDDKVLEARYVGCFAQKEG